MPTENTPTPTPDPASNPTPADSKKPRSKSPIDQRTANQLRSDREIIAAALDEINSDPAFGAALATHFLDQDGTVPINAANLQALSEQATAAEQAGAAITEHSSAAQDVTKTETGDKNKAVAAVRKIQSAAKEKHEETHKEKLGAYYVAQRLDSRQRIESAATACWHMVRTSDDAGNPITPQDTLPGIGAAQLTQIKADLAGYVTVQAAQSGAQKDASDARTAYAQQCDQIQRRRRRLQQAINTERPHTDENNKALRRRLGLPTDQGMK